MSNDKQVTILLVDPDIDYLDWATKHLETDTVQILRCNAADKACLLYTSPSPRDGATSRMPSSA